MPIFKKKFDDGSTMKVDVSARPNGDHESLSLKIEARDPAGHEIAALADLRERQDLEKVWAALATEVKDQVGSGVRTSAKIPKEIPGTNIDMYPTQADYSTVKKESTAAAIGVLESHGFEQHVIDRKKMAISAAETSLGGMMRELNAAGMNPVERTEALVDTVLAKSGLRPEEQVNVLEASLRKAQQLLDAA